MSPFLLQTAVMEASIGQSWHVLIRGESGVERINKKEQRYQREVRGTAGRKEMRDTKWEKLGGVYWAVPLSKAHLGAPVPDIT